MPSHHPIPSRRPTFRAIAVCLALLLLPCAAIADEPAASAAVAPVINAGDTAWVLISGVLVLFMTIPGLALFYAGLVRTKNVLTIFTQCFAVTCLITVLWTIYGYSLAFDTAGQVAGQFTWHSLIGSFAKCGMLGVTPESVAVQAPTVPEPIFAFFQLTFAIITPALLVGAFAERLKFAAVLWVCGLWLTLVYIPVCHMAWGGPGSLMGGCWGLLDLAGGTVVEVNAGVAGLVCALVVGRRLGYPHTAMLPHNSAMCITGACMLWVGWFGFNAGSAGSAGALAARAALTTQIAAATAGFTWMLIEWVRYGRPGALGMVTGAVAGLVAITPACGSVGPLGALAVGVAAGVASFLVIVMVKRRFGYDDTLDVFGVHGIGGMVGLVLTGVFAPAFLGGAGFAGDHGWGGQILAQLAGMGLTTAYSAVGTVVVLWLTARIVRLRAAPGDEENGLDYVQHGEAAYNP